jgi:hypothetical protein
MPPAQPDAPNAPPVMRSATLSAPACGWVRGGIVKRGTRHVGRWRCDPRDRGQRGDQGDTLPSALADPACAAHRADDAAIMADSADDLAAALAAVDDWCDASGLALNAAKCKVMVLHGAAPAADGVSPHAAAARVDWRVRGGAVATTDAFTYLGVPIVPGDVQAAAKAIVDGSLARGRRALATWGHVLRDPALHLPVRLLVAKSCVLGAARYGLDLVGGHGARTLAVFDTFMRDVCRAVVQPPAHRHNLAYPAMLQEVGLPCAMALTRGGTTRLLTKGASSRTLLAEFVASLGTWRQAARPPHARVYTVTAATWGLFEHMTRCKQDGRPLFAAPAADAGALRAPGSAALAPGGGAAAARAAGAAVAARVGDHARANAVRDSAAGRVGMRRYAAARLAATRAVAAFRAADAFVTPADAAALVRARLGAVTTAFNYRTGPLPREPARATCPACSLDAPDTLAHILLRCPAYAAPRARTGLDAAAAAARARGLGDDDAATLALGGAAAGVAARGYVVVGEPSRGALFTAPVVGRFLAVVLPAHRDAVLAVRFGGGGE